MIPALSPNPAGGDSVNMLDFLKGREKGQKRLKRKLDMNDPIDQEIFLLSKKNMLSVEFCNLD